LQTNAQAAGPAPAAPAAWPATVGAPEPGAVLADAGAESVGPKTDTQVPDGTEGTARGGEPTINAGIAGSLTATPMLLTLALGLVAAGAVTRVVMKIAAARRAAVMIDHPSSRSHEGLRAWVRRMGSVPGLMRNAFWGALGAALRRGGSAPFLASPLERAFRPAAPMSACVALP
jgi:hypothetical protein